MKWFKRLCNPGYQKGSVSFKVDIDTASARRSIVSLRNELAQLKQEQSEQCVLTVSNGKVPILFYKGKNYPVSHLSYQYETSSLDSKGINYIVATIIDADNHVAKDIAINIEHCTSHVTNTYSLQ